MVEETIREIRAAEARADEIVKEAREKSVIQRSRLKRKPGRLRRRLSRKPERERRNWPVRRKKRPG